MGELPVVHVVNDEMGVGSWMLGMDGYLVEMFI